MFYLAKGYIMVYGETNQGIKHPEKCNLYKVKRNFKRLNVLFTKRL